MKLPAIFAYLVVSALPLASFSCTSTQTLPPTVSVKQRLLRGCSTSACRRLRSALAEKAALSFLQTDNDTIFLMESTGFDDGRPVGRIWTRKGVAAFAYDPNNKSFDFAVRPFYKHHIGLVEKFDSASLDAERPLLKTPGYGIASGYRSVVATRMVKNGSRQECKSFSFVEVIYPKRDFYEK